jgi:membrane protein DedA with SNARE-associated domain
MGDQVPEQRMTKYEKILVVVVLGSLWGAVELFGRDLLRAAGVPGKGALLFGFGVIILYASKRLVDVPGSVVVMAAIAGLFKTASSHFYPCQFAAVMINGIVFDITCSAFKGRLDSSAVYRTIAAPVIVYASYAVFAFLATYVLREESWVAEGWAGIRLYLLSSAVTAALISMVTIHLGYYLGNALRPDALAQKLRMPAVAFRIVSVVLVAAIWIAGQVYRTI